VEVLVEVLIEVLVEVLMEVLVEVLVESLMEVLMELSMPARGVQRSILRYKVDSAGDMVGNGTSVLQCDASVTFTEEKRVCRQLQSPRWATTA
jgi:hypothetical protein